MSWRRFVVLLNGLGPWSIWVITADERGPLIEDPKVAERKVFSALGI
jgi:hypothetical protein